MNSLPRPALPTSPTVGVGGGELPGEGGLGEPGPDGFGSPDNKAPPPNIEAASRYKSLAWAFVAYTLLVVLWGAYVRATGSGAGCGDHWPLCNGEVIPRVGLTATAIEFTHRVTSGLGWFFALGFVIWARHAFCKAHGARRLANWSLFFYTTEALIGAGIVLFQMVADNASFARGYWMAAHLTNTFLLLGALALHADASGSSLKQEHKRATGPGVWLIWAALIATLLTGVGGAVAALGDTLFPSETLEEALAADFSATSHLFIRLRILHPLFAIVSMGVISAALSWVYRARPELRRGVWVVGILLVVQMLGGLLNLRLLAPIWMQLVHLLLADGLWLALVILALRVRETQNVSLGDLTGRGVSQSGATLGP